MHMTPKIRKLLVLDLDETLVHATENALGHDEDFRVGPYRVHLRPHLADFVSNVLAQFKVGVWTASGESYALQIVERIFPSGTLEFVWSSARCTTTRDWTTGEYQSIKNLQKLKSKGYPLESIIAVDDTPSKYARSYGNLVTVREFVGDRSDAELPLLATYLTHLADVPNVRRIEKRNWREHIQRHTGMTPPAD
ncbi:carboxy-terminal domain RNA polymerase II polypeptide A small phosphatase [Variovorax sp. YR634]|jgi:RNA polymerase II subunit A small phosphatase-like protein|nr:carboxy-terminal domain RNA polymerase II polypeptide A small phosphatase [Variovorax sp. YR634]SDZ71860.1 carboxy-terminal domain RNA polymerase II polypeptide A small phosphatase [Variovorax sp. YR266]